MKTEQKQMMRPDTPEYYESSDCPIMQRLDIIIELLRRDTSPLLESLSNIASKVDDTTSAVHDLDGEVSGWK